MANALLISPLHHGTGSFTITCENYTRNFNAEVGCYGNASFSTTINTGTLKYDGSAKNLTSSTSTSGISSYSLGYKKGSQATSDSQITWQTNPSGGKLTATDAGTYYIYKKYTVNRDYCGSDLAYTYVGSKVIGCGDAYVATNGWTHNGSQYMEYNPMDSQKVYLKTKNNTGSLTQPGSVTYADGYSTSGTWTLYSDSGGYYIMIPAGIHGGTWSVTASFSIAASSDGNYCSGTKSITWSIYIACRLPDLEISGYDADYIVDHSGTLNITSTYPDSADFTISTGYAPVDFYAGGYPASSDYILYYEGRIGAHESTTFYQLEEVGYEEFYVCFVSPNYENWCHFPGYPDQDSIQVTVTVQKYTPTITFTNLTKKYNGTVLTPNAIVSLPSGGKRLKGTIHYGYTGSSGDHYVSYDSNTGYIWLEDAEIRDVGSRNVWAWFEPDSTCNDVYNNSPSDSGSIASTTISVTKGDNPMTLSKSSVTLYSDAYCSTYKTASITVNNNAGTPTASSSNTSVATVSAFNSSNNTFTVTYVGAGSATITVTDPGNSNYNSGTKTCSVTCYVDEEYSTQYKDQACTTQGVNITYGTPTVTIGNSPGLTCAGGSATVSCSVTNSSSWYQKWKSGCVKPHSGSPTGTATWSITTQTFTPSGGSASTITRFSSSGNTLSHATMGTNVGTDYVKITAVNSGDSSKTAIAEKSITNSVTNSDYNATNSNYTASVSIGNGLTCAGGSATVTASASHTHTYYYLYCSGSTSGPYTSTPSDTVTWSITSQTFTPSGGSASTITRFSSSGNTLSHSSMGTNVGVDYVKITATNAGNSNATATAEKSITNSVTNSDYNASNSNYTVSVTISGGPVAGTSSATVTTNASHTHTYYYLYCSGSTSGPYTSTVSDGASWSITSQTFTPSGGSASTITRFSKNASTGKLDHSSMGTNVGTDFVEITAINTGDNTATASTSRSITNAITDYDYNASNSNYNVSVSIGDGLTAGGGSATVTASGSHTRTYYYYYNSGSTSGPYTSTPSDTVTWSITTQTFTPSGGSASTITRFSKNTSTGKLDHSTMGTNVGTDYIKITATGGNNTTATAEKSITNALTNSNFNPSGYTVDVSIGNGLGPGASSATVTASASHVAYNYYTSGSADPSTHTVNDSVSWSITSQTFNTSTVITRFSKSGNTLSHSSMNDTVGTDKVTITATNGSNSSTTKAVSKEVTNSKDSTNYSPSNYTASVSIGNGLGPGVSSATVTVSGSHTAYDYYTSGYYNNSHTVTGDGATWSITSQTFNTSTTITRFSKSGNTLSHSSMNNNVGTDKVTITATNSVNSSGTATASKEVTNSKDSTNYSPSNYTASVSIGNGLTAAGGSATVTVSGSHTAYDYYTSGYYDNSHTVNDGATWSITSQTFAPATGGSSSTITRFSKSSNTLSHSSMGTNAGTDYVKITASNSTDSNATAIAEKSITNAIITTQKYKNTSGTTGYNITYVTPTVSIGNGFTAAGGSATVTCSVTNNTDWYYKYDSGNYTSQYTSTEAGTAKWRITSNGNSRFSEPSSGGSTITVGGSNVTVYSTGSAVSHSSMGTSATTDSVTVTAYNVGDTTKSATASKSVTNSLGSTKYKNTSGTEGYNITYVAPTCTLTNNLTAAGGSVTVTCSVTNNTDWYQRYTSGSYTAKQTGTEAGTAKWRITSNGNSRFSEPSSGGSTITVGGSNVTVYSTGTDASHSNMTTNATTDTVGITAYNVGDPTKTSGEKTVSIGNAITNSNYSPSNYTASISIGNGLIAAGGSATVSASASHKAYDLYTSGSYNNQHNVSDSVTWEITSNGNSRFTKTNNTTLSHSNMTTNAVTDSVTVKATNSTDTTATATASKSITNAVESISLAVNGKTDATSVPFGSSIASSNIVLTGTYTSGSTGTLTPKAVSSSDTTVATVS